MDVGVLFSGGKDSCLALHSVRQRGDNVKCLLNISPKNFDSFMFHKPYLNLLKRQAEELGIKLIQGETKGEKEKELKDLKEILVEVKQEIEGVVVGGIASNYQGKRIKKICDELGLKFIAPLWDYSSEQVWKDLIENRFEIVMTKIACEGLGTEWLGRVIDKNNFGELKKLSEKYKFRLDFEGGEAETSVLFMPGFKNKIKINFSVESEGKHRHWMTEVILKK